MRGEVMRLLGLDPGLRVTGWGVVDVTGNRYRFVAAGVVRSDGGRGLAERLLQLHDGLAAVVTQYRPAEAAVEETFMNTNAASALKLGQARGIALLVPAVAGVPVSEYAANLIKKSVVGFGHAGKGQIQAMIATLLPGAGPQSPDAADALAVALCHAHHRQSAALLAAVRRAAISERVG